jgi:hypothetical protein
MPWLDRPNDGRAKVIPARILLKYCLVAILAGVVLSMIVLSPLAMRTLATRTSDWQQLSDVGQAYGGISAVLSGLALLGIVGTVILQSRQIRETRYLALRDQHQALLRLAMENPRYNEAWGNSPSPPELDRDVTIYTNLVVNWFVTRYVVGASAAKDVRTNATYFFDGAVGRSYWSYVGKYWLRESQGKEAEALRIFHEEYERALRAGPPSRPLPAKTVGTEAAGSWLLRRLLHGSRTPGVGNPSDQDRTRRATRA